MFNSAARPPEAELLLIPADWGYAFCPFACAAFLKKLERRTSGKKEAVEQRKKQNGKSDVQKCSDNARAYMDGEVGAELIAEDICRSTRYSQGIEWGSP